MPCMGCPIMAGVRKEPMKPKSHTLFHFTKSADTLKLMLKGGFWPRYCLEDIHWLVNEKFPYIAYPMVCFCDIPLSRIQEHVGFYGEFGLGLTKEWAESNGLNPVSYVSSGNNMTASLIELNDHANKHESDEDKEATKKTMRYIYAHSKPLNGSMVVDGSPVPKEFYQESEWRYVPKHDQVEAYIRKSDFDNEDALSKYNTLSKEHCTLRFSPKDIKYIFVKSDSDIPNIINFIQGEMDNHPAADLKVMMSRVTSLESISQDV